MSQPLDQVLREQAFIKAHPEWRIHAQDKGSRFTAETESGSNSHIVAALSLEGLLNRLEQIVGEGDHG